MLFQAEDNLLPRAFYGQYRQRVEIVYWLIQGNHEEVCLNRVANQARGLAAFDLVFPRSSIVALV